MFTLIFKLFLSTLPFFKEMLFGKKTVLEKLTGFITILCFLLMCLSLIIFNSVTLNFKLKKTNKELLEQISKQELIINTLKENEQLRFCSGKDIIIAKLEERLKGCSVIIPVDNSRIERVKERLNRID